MQRHETLPSDADTFDDYSAESFDRPSAGYDEADSHHLTSEQHEDSEQQNEINLDRVMVFKGESMTLREAIDRCPHLKNLGENALKGTLEKTLGIQSKSEKRKEVEKSLPEKEAAEFRLQSDLRGREALMASIKAKGKSLDTIKRIDQVVEERQRSPERPVKPVISAIRIESKPSKTTTATERPINDSSKPQVTLSVKLQIEETSEARHTAEEPKSANFAKQPEIITTAATTIVAEEKSTQMNVTPILPTVKYEPQNDRFTVENEPTVESEIDVKERLYLVGSEVSTPSDIEPINPDNTEPIGPSEILPYSTIAIESNNHFAPDSDSQVEQFDPHDIEQLTVSDATETSFETPVSDEVQFNVLVQHSENSPAADEMQQDGTEPLPLQLFAQPENTVVEPIPQFTREEDANNTIGPVAIATIEEFAAIVDAIEIKTETDDEAGTSEINTQTADALTEIEQILMEVSETIAPTADIEHDGESELSTGNIVTEFNVTELATDEIATSESASELQYETDLSDSAEASIAKTATIEPEEIVEIESEYGIEELAERLTVAIEKLYQAAGKEIEPDDVRKLAHLLIEKRLNTPIISPENVTSFERGTHENLIRLIGQFKQLHIDTHGIHRLIGQFALDHLHSFDLQLQAA